MTEKPGKARERHHRQLHQFGTRQKWRCIYCHRPIRCSTCQPGEARAATWDHVIPKARGGTRAKRNLVLACGPCNCEKSDSPADEFSGRL